MLKNVFRFNKPVKSRYALNYKILIWVENRNLAQTKALLIFSFKVEFEKALKKKLYSQMLLILDN